jgi:hypothetical protein
MTGPENYVEAQRWARQAAEWYARSGDGGDGGDEAIASAWACAAIGQVHATLAAAAASSFFGEVDVDGWGRVLGMSSETVGGQPPAPSYTAPRGLDRKRLRPGDQVLVLPAAPDTDATWVASWSDPVDRPVAATRWMTVAAIVYSDASEAVAVELDDHSVLELAASLDWVWVRIPCEATT